MVIRQEGTRQEHWAVGACADVGKKRHRREEAAEQRRQQQPGREDTLDKTPRKVRGRPPPPMALRKRKGLHDIATIELLSALGLHRAAGASGACVAASGCCQGWRDSLGTFRNITSWHFGAPEPAVGGP